MASRPPGCRQVVRRETSDVGVDASRQDQDPRASAFQGRAGGVCRAGRLAQTVMEPLYETARDTYAEIGDAPENEQITRVEILSPGNQRHGRRRRE